MPVGRLGKSGFAGKGGNPVEITISGRHTQVTEAMQEYVKAKVQRLERYFDGVHHAAVTLTVEDTRQTAELVFSLVKGQTVVAQAEHEDMYAAIDLSVDKMKRSLKKFKAKLRDRRGATGAFSRIGPPQPVREEEPEEES